MSLKGVLVRLRWFMPTVIYRIHDESEGFYMEYRRSAKIGSCDHADHIKKGVSFLIYFQLDLVFKEVDF